MGIFVVQMGDFVIHITMGAKRIVQISLFMAIQLMKKFLGLRCSRLLVRAIAMMCRFTAELGILFSHLVTDDAGCAYHCYSCINVPSQVTSPIIVILYKIWLCRDRKSQIYSFPYVELNSITKEMKTFDSVVLSPISHSNTVSSEPVCTIH